MPDDIRIPSLAPDARAPVSTRYRTRQPGPGLSGRAMVLAAVAAGVLLLGFGGWAVMGRRPAAVPVIEADSRPIRVKPENPGGMQVVGADEQVSGGGAGGADRMAPAAEAPAPQALRAQMKQDQPAAAPVAEAAPAVVPAGASPLPDTPARAQQAARGPVAAPAKPAAAAAAAAGGTLVQLAAVDTEAAAQAEWQRLGKRMPELLGDRRPVVQRAERDGKPVWRVRTGGFADMADATGFCTKVKAKGGSCTIASF